jgi:hypothetical protein
MPMQRNSDHGPDAHVRVEGGRDRVVKLPAVVGKGGYVDGDADDAPRCGLLRQIPSADLRLSSREVTSQVNPSSERPKWP